MCHCCWTVPSAQGQPRSFSGDGMGYRGTCARCALMAFTGGLGKLLSFSFKKKAAGMSASQPGSALLWRMIPAEGFFSKPVQSLARPRERRVIILVPCSSNWLVHHKRMLMFMSL